MKRAALRLLAAFAALALALCAAEIAVRLLYGAKVARKLALPDAGAAFAAAGMLRAVEQGGVRYTGRPGSAIVIRDIAYRHNRLGLRGPDPAPAGGTFRVLVLGDSNTYGWGAREQETFAAVAERELAGRGGSRPVEFINAGLPGYNTADARALFLRLAPDLRPNVVLLAWFLNDLEHLGFHVNAEGELFADPLPTPDAWKALLWRSFAYRLISIERVAALKERGEYGNHSERDTAACEAAMAGLAEAVAAAGARFLILDVPWLEPGPGSPLLLRENYLGARESGWLERTAARHAIPAFSLLDSLVGQHVALLWASLDPPDHHPNARAHRAMGEALAAELLRRGLVP